MMKKTLSTLFALFLLTGLMAQKKTIDILTKKLGKIERIVYAKEVDLDKGDTAYYIYMGFQNAKYSTITDIKSIILTKEEDLAELIKDLRLALPEMGTKTTLHFDRKKYSLAVYDFTKELSFGQAQNNGSGYCFLNKKDVEKLIALLETIQFGKDELLTPQPQK